MADKFLSARAVAKLLLEGEGSVRNVRLALRRAIDGKPWHGASLLVRRAPAAKGGERYEVRVDSLPDFLQARYHLAITRASGEATDEPELNNRGGERFTSRLTISEHHTLWAAFERLPTSMQHAAEQRLQAVLEFADARDRLGPLTQREVAACVAEKHGISAATLLRWWREIRALDRSDWLPALAPRYQGCQVEAEFTRAAWDLIVADYLRQSKPALSACVERARRLAPENGWIIPSVGTVLNRIRALPTWMLVYGREGEEALQRMFPARSRDYTTLAVHALWVADGRRADVFCRWPDGTINRPIVVAWQDVRSRKVLGWHVAKTESADLIRLAFRRAAQKASAIPDEILVDNGRGFASKLLTGGAKTRFRFKVKDDDPLGIFPMMGVNVVWALPYSGRSKPIEPWFNNIAQHVDKLPAFDGAYCGNRPDAKPENCDPRKAVPVDRYVVALTEAIEQVNARSGHRGHSMQGRSPNEIYAEFLPLAQPRQPTAAQLRRCLMARERVKLSREDGSVSFCGNRYWTERLAELPRGSPVDLYGDPDDASVPVEVCDGERLLAIAPLVARTGFRDRQAAKDHLRAQRQFTKARKAEAKATIAKADARRWSTPPDPNEAASGSARTPNTETPTPRVARLMHVLDPKVQDDFDRKVAEGVALNEQRRFAEG